MSPAISSGRSVCDRYLTPDEVRIARVIGIPFPDNFPPSDVRRQINRHLEMQEVVELVAASKPGLVTSRDIKDFYLNLSSRRRHPTGNLAFQPA